MDMEHPIAVQQAARELARLSVEVRKAKWGEEGFKRRLRAWGKLGGRPKGSGKNKPQATGKGGR